MSTNNDGWILMSERKPTQFPVWLYDGEATDGFKTWMHCNGGIAGSATHWKPAAADIPSPPMEETQAEKDLAAFEAWYPKNLCCQDGWRGVWHAALAHERAEVGKLLPSSKPATYNAHYATEVIKAIRARCGGGK